MIRLPSLFLILLIATAFPTAAQEPVKVRLGHFPNITHGQALVARQLARQGRGWFEERLGPGVQVEWFVYNAGPSAMEAILAGSIDATYVGPNPVLNAHIRAKGAEIRVIAVMLIIVLIGLLADKILFSPWERFLHRRWGTARV